MSFSRKKKFSKVSKHKVLDNLPVPESEKLEKSEKETVFN